MAKETDNGLREQSRQLTIHQALDLAVQHHNAGRFPQAKQIYQQILKAQPNHPAALHLLGVVAYQESDHARAVELISKAIVAKPDYADAHRNLGSVLRDLGRFDEAVASYREALSIKPDYTDAHNNLGSALRDLGRLDEAVASYRNALAIEPDHAGTHNNLGNALRDQGWLDQAIACYNKALATDPSHASAHNNLGSAFRDLGRLDEAFDSYRKALAVKPDHADAHKNLGHLQLLTGDFQNGWENHAWRLRAKSFADRPRQYKKPFWDGSPLDGKTLFVYPEQGYGDAIQFARYVVLVAADADRVVFGVLDPLVHLFSSLGPGIDLLASGEPPPPFDYHTPLLELPRLLKTTLESVPADVPYLAADPEREKQWANRLGSQKGFKIGIAWAGNPKHFNDRNRSVEPTLFRPLTALPDVSIYSLQVGRDGEAGRVFGDDVTDLAPWLSDFADTAAAMKNLDLVLSVDTAVAHIAGALDRPVWTLVPFMPDWRWLLQREDSPWYPSMRLFRQDTQGDWQSVMARVREALIQTADR